MSSASRQDQGLAFLTALGICITLLAALPSRAAGQAGQVERPNILWISCEDISCHLGCYGDKQATTPTLDRLARESVRYSHAFTISGVCAVNRSGIISGMYSTSLGTQHMRCTARLPEHIRCFPTYLRAAGYYCTNNSKTDYNFRYRREAWDESSSTAHWRGREQGQPFFAVFNLTTTHESRIASQQRYEQAIADLPKSELHDPGQLNLPPYYPDTPKVRQDWARYYDLISAMDRQVARLLEDLEGDGLSDETIVFFWSDHGVGLPRAKRWLYDSGTRIPLIVRIPKRFRLDGQGVPGTIADELVSSIDLAPTVLNLARVALPDHIQGRAFLGSGLTAPRQYVFGHRDRMDERYDIIRSVRDKRYKYIRNYEPWKPYYQYMNTPEKGSTMQELRRLHAASQLPPPAALFMAASKPIEELYDVQTDPHELQNLASSSQPEHQAALRRLRKAHLQWVERTRDTGLLPEPELIRRERIVGSRFQILRQSDSQGLMQRIARVAGLGQQGPAAVPQLREALTDPDAAVRYWAAIGLGNLKEQAAACASKLRQALHDESPSVRIAAARALCRMGELDPALTRLIQELGSSQQWVRLQAAIVLDEMQQQARPAIASLKQALRDRENKYVVRVANRALNELLGTANAVP